MTTNRTTASRTVTCLVAAVSCAALASCAGPTPGTPVAVPATSAASPTAQPATGPVALDGWKLTLPVAGPKGTAAGVDPARFSPPWLTQDPSGGLAFWAPAGGATTPNSSHPRTELVGLDVFPAGSGPHALTASLSVAQVPAAGQDVIIGQIHGAEKINSVPFIMLHYRAGIIEVVVKRGQSGSASDRFPLLYGVPLGERFDFGIRDNGNGTYTFTASHGTERASRDAPLPAAFEDATVRFQAGAYQQSDADPRTASADDGARLTFYALRTDSG